MQKSSTKTGQNEILPSISSILEDCISIERYTHKKYGELANQTDNMRAKELFRQLSMSGEAHALMLTEVKESLAQSNEIAKNVTVSTRLQIPETGDLPDEPGVKQIYYAMKKHLNLEQDFRTTYTKLSEETNSLTAQELFRLLIADETNHHKLLSDLIRAFENTYQSLLK